MSIKYPKSVILGVSVVAALLAGTVLLGAYAGSKPADTKAPVKACQVSGGVCPIMAMQAETTGCNKTPCTEGCPKPCCAGENAEGACDNPCPIPCPKPCCAEEGQKGCCGTSSMAGCSMTAAKTAAQ